MQETQQREWVNPSRLPTSQVSAVALMTLWQQMALDTKPKEEVRKISRQATIPFRRLKANSTLSCRTVRNKAT